MKDYGHKERRVFLKRRHRVVWPEILAVAALTAVWMILIYFFPHLVPL